MTEELTLSQYIRHERLKKKLTLRKLSKKARVGTSTISRLENGNKQLKLPSINKLALALNLDQGLIETLYAKYRKTRQPVDKTFSMPMKFEDAVNSWNDIAQRIETLECAINEINERSLVIGEFVSRVSKFLIAYQAKLDIQSTVKPTITYPDAMNGVPKRRFWLW